MTPEAAPPTYAISRQWPTPGHPLYVVHLGRPFVIARVSKFFINDLVLHVNEGGLHGLTDEQSHALVTEMARAFWQEHDTGIPFPKNWAWTRGVLNDLPAFLSADSYLQMWSGVIQLDNGEATAIWSLNEDVNRLSLSMYNGPLPSPDSLLQAAKKVSAYIVEYLETEEDVLCEKAL